MLRSGHGTTSSADNNYGEMFLNFWLHPELWKYAGIDLTGICPEELKDVEHPRKKQKHVLWEAWSRCAMGLTSSPLQAMQAIQRVKCISLGDQHNPSNIFCWSQVELNLPGSTSYDPSRSWVQKVREDGQLATDVHLYVDDLREMAPTEDKTWLAASGTAKTSLFFGL
ncbi:hypothetical protein ACA910_017593 [Epithemia clementina (nom. ined.)]